MKRIFTLLVLVVAMIGAATSTATACKKTAAKAATTQDSVVCIVMDTTNALLPGAKVSITCGKKQSFTTGVDGRVVVRMTGKTVKVKVTDEGYKTQQLTLQAGTREQIIRLVPEKQKEIIAYGHGGRALGITKDAVSFSTSAKSISTSAESSFRIRGVASITAPMADEAMLYTEDALSFDEDVEPVIVTGYGSVANDARAGLLTAGEVNDFAKWTLWDSLVLGSHAKFVPQWGLHLTQRFTVQLTNQKGYPLSNRYVALTDSRGTTLFQARTDNTGKAELWGSLTSKQAQDGLYVTAEGQRVQAKPYKEGLIRIQTDEACGAQDEADVLFVIDATGSMGDELRYLCAEMKDVIRRSQGAVEGLKIRTGALVYRDHGDDYLTRISRLTSDINETQQFLDRQHAGGGGDFEEAVPEALKAALNVADWNDEARARIIFLVLDAPCHDDFATISMLHEQVRNAAAMGVRIVPVVCSGLDKAGELLMREIALTTNGTSFFLTDDSGIGGEHLKPTTDAMKVEHLNDMLVRTIVEFTTMPNCEPSVAEEEEQDEEGQFVPNPFKAEDLATNPDLPHGPTTLYLIDVSGKLLTILEGDMQGMTAEQVAARYGLSAGVYFLKAFYDGQWHTRKLLVRGL